jgi:hypothetical protein
MPQGYTNSAKPRRRTTGTRCVICKHAERPRIEMLHCAGVGIDALAEQFHVSRDSVWRHVTRHVSDEKRVTYLLGPAKIARLAEVAATENQSVVEYFGILRSTLFGQLDRLAAKNDHAGVAAIAARLTDVLQQIGKITGVISGIASSTIVNITHNTQILNSAPFSDLQAGLIRVCAQHPEARADILSLFRDLDARYGAPAPKLIDVTTAREAARG